MLWYFIPFISTAAEADNFSNKSSSIILFYILHISLNNLAPKVKINFYCAHFRIFIVQNIDFLLRKNKIQKYALLRYMNKPVLKNFIILS